MEPSVSRFERPSSPLQMKALLRGARGAVWTALLLALGVHVSLTRIAGSEAEEKAAKPLTTQFVKRAPRLTKPLELKKRPQPKRRQVQREMVAVKARMQRDQSSVRFEPTQALRGLARPSSQFQRATSPGSVEMEPASIAVAVEGTKEVEQKIDMSLELLDISALNTGQYHAMVIQDPEDKRNLKGFCRLSWLYIPRLHDRAIPETGSTGNQWAHYYVGGPVRNLVKALNEYTPIDAYVGERVSIDAPETFRVPWIYHLYFFEGYMLSDSELDILGRYMVGGGFIFADAHPFAKHSVASSHVENLLRALHTQGIRTAFEILPESHPIYHCFFDFTMPPPGADALINRYPTYDATRTLYLEGLVVDKRLVAILSRKGYYHPWMGAWGPGEGNLDPTRQFQFGVNLIVFALTQEGSITRRLMESVR